MQLARPQSGPTFFSPRATIHPPMAALRIATFNVLCGYPFGPRVWSEQQSLLRRSIKAARPDVVGLQELLPSNLADIANLVAPLTLVPGPSTGPTRWFGVGASSERNQGGEYLPIAYQEDRFELRDSGGFWISATPARRGSMLPLARTPFLVHWARLAPRDRSGSLLVMNAHFGRTPWHHAPTAQVVSELLVALEAASPERCATRFGLTLDYVVARTPSRPARAELSDAHNGGLYPSDHHLLVLKFVPDRSPGCASDRHVRRTPR